MGIVDRMVWEYEAGMVEKEKSVNIRDKWSSKKKEWIDKRELLRVFDLVKKWCILWVKLYFNY